jgi:hypothetical protein
MMDATGIEPATRRKQNPEQVALLPANALISHRIVPPLRPVSSRLVPSRPVQFPAGGVESTGGAVPLGFVGACCEGSLSLALSPSLTHGPFPPRRSSNRTCRFPASGSRTGFTRRVSAQKCTWLLLRALPGSTLAFAYSFARRSSSFVRVLGSRQSPAAFSPCEAS